MRLTKRAEGYGGSRAVNCPVTQPGELALYFGENTDCPPKTPGSFAGDLVCHGTMFPVTHRLSFDPTNPMEVWQYTHMQKALLRDLDTNCRAYAVLPVVTEEEEF